MAKILRETAACCRRRYRRRFRHSLVLLSAAYTFYMHTPCTDKSRVTRCWLTGQRLSGYVTNDKRPSDSYPLEYAAQNRHIMEGCTGSAAVVQEVCANAVCR